LDFNSLQCSKIKFSENIENVSVHVSRLKMFYKALPNSAPISKSRQKSNLMETSKNDPSIIFNNSRAPVSSKEMKDMKDLKKITKNTTGNENN